MMLLAMCFAAGACSTPPAMAPQPLAPRSDATVRHETGFFRGAGDVQIFTQSWHPKEKARGALVIHHGLKSHSEHYDELARRLVAKGFAVYALDMRGHGRSGGPRATLDDFDDLLADLDAVVEKARAAEAGRPIFIAGHSVGGAVVTLYAVEQKSAISGLIVLAPAIRIDRPAIEAAATPIASFLLPNFGAVDVPNEHFSRDPEVVAEMDRDPLVYQPAGPARTAAGLLDALERIWSRADELDVPLLALHGTGDKATDPRGSTELVDRAKTNDSTLLLYRGLYHDLVREPERDQVMTDIENWLVERAP